MPLQNQKGFSLPELMIVVMIILILVVLAIPQMRGSVYLNSLQTSSAVISSKMSEARMMAVKQNRTVSVVFDETRSQVWLEANSTVIGHSEQLPNGIKVKVNPDSPNAKEVVIFNSMGALSSAPATVSTYYAPENLEVPVSVSISGKITLGAMKSY